MDCGNVYIKMCEQATEIQELRKPKIEMMGIIFPIRVGDFLACGGKVDVYNGWSYWSASDIFWLPRQDQLQEIYSNYVQEQLGIIHSEIKQAFLDFAHWLGEQYLPESFVCVPTNCFETGEQLWLAFLMQELYQKKWDGEKWK